MAATVLTADGVLKLRQAPPPLGVAGQIDTQPMGSTEERIVVQVLELFRCCGFHWDGWIDGLMD